MSVKQNHTAAALSLVTLGHSRGSASHSPLPPLPAGDATPLPKQDAAQKDSETLSVNGTLVDLLAEQRIAVERALAFNEIISQRLLGRDDLWHSSTPSAHSMKHHTTPDLATPLAARTKNESWSVNETLARCQALLSINPPPEQAAFSEDLRRPLLPQAEADSSLKSHPRRNLVSFSTEGAENKEDESADNKGEDAQDQMGDDDVGPTGKSKGKSQRLWNLFPSVDHIKEQIISSMGEGLVGQAENKYHETGFWQFIAFHPYFNHVVFTVIIFNTIWIAIDTDMNQAEILSDAPAFIQVVENTFCAFFVFEMCCRIFCFQRKCDAFKDGWLVFDLALVLSMAWETWIVVLWYKLFGTKNTGRMARTSSIFRLFRLFRLTRVARTARLVGNIPELMILAKGMLLAMRSVAAVLSLMGLVIYIFSIIFTELLRDTDVGDGTNFDSVLHSFNTLLLQVVCGFDIDIVQDLIRIDFTCYFVYLVFFLIASLTIMNMLIGILCDVVSNVATDEKEASFVQEVESLVKSLMKELDTDGSRTLSKSEFDGIIMNQDMMQVLMEFGVDVVGIVDFADFLFNETDELSFDDFLSLVVQFRISKAATMRDVMDMRKYMARELSHLESVTLRKLIMAQASTARHSVTVQCPRCGSVDSISGRSLRHSQSTGSIKD